MIMTLKEYLDIKNIFIQEIHDELQIDAGQQQGERLGHLLRNLERLVSPLPTDAEDDGDGLVTVDAQLFVDSLKLATIKDSIFFFNFVLACVQNLSASCDSPVSVFMHRMLSIIDQLQIIMIIQLLSAKISDDNIGRYSILTLGQRHKLSSLLAGSIVDKIKKNNNAASSSVVRPEISSQTLRIIVTDIIDFALDHNIKFGSIADLLVICKDFGFARYASNDVAQLETVELIDNIIHDYKLTFHSIEIDAVANSIIAYDSIDRRYDALLVKNDAFLTKYDGSDQANGRMVYFLHKLNKQQQLDFCNLLTQLSKLLTQEIAIKRESSVHNWPELAKLLFIKLKYEELQCLCDFSISHDVYSVLQDLSFGDDGANNKEQRFVYAFKEFLTINSCWWLKGIMPTIKDMVPGFLNFCEKMTPDEVIENLQKMAVQVEQEYLRKPDLIIDEGINPHTTVAALTLLRVLTGIAQEYRSDYQFMHKIKLGLMIMGCMGVAICAYVYRQDWVSSAMQQFFSPLYLGLLANLSLVGVVVAAACFVFALYYYPSIVKIGNGFNSANKDHNIVEKCSNTDNDAIAEQVRTEDEVVVKQGVGINAQQANRFMRRSKVGGCF